MSRSTPVQESTEGSSKRRALGFGVLASLLAFIGRSAARAADALTINSDGEVSIDKLSVQKSLAVAGPAKIAGSNTLEFGAGVERKESNAGKIGYQTFTTGALDIVGAGDAKPKPEEVKRRIKFWAEGGATLAGGLDVTGTVKAQSLETDSGISLAAVQGALNLLVPIGTIVAYGGDITNVGVASALKGQGWLPCNGSAYSAQDYPELARAIGSSFGSLRVPDLRGRFLRGTDQGTGRDPDSTSRRAENGGNSGDKVGSVQDDDFKRHRHSYNTFPAARGGIAAGDYWRNGDDQTGETGGNETRPKNVNVNWIIRAK
jgi:Phage Tail Collar Domain